MLLALWQTQGVGSWVGGLFTVCMPADFQELLLQVFERDKDFSHSDCHVFGYSAFGIVFAWSERFGLVRIDLLRSEVTARGLTADRKTAPSESALTAMLYMLSERDTLDAFDDDGRKLFNRTVKKHGRPIAGQAFGFFPALALGGAPRVENLRIVTALEHFLFLAQLQRLKLTDYLLNPPRVVRMVG